MTKIGNILNGDLVDRRRFLKGTAAAGLATMLPFSAPGKAHAQSPKSGGRMRVGLSHGSTTDSLDPAVANSNGYLGVLNHAQNNRLVSIAVDGSLEPELAISWEGSDGAKKWVFELRQGVQYHDGRTMTSDDVIASLNYHSKEDSTSSAKSLLGGVVSMKADGPHTVVFQLSAGNTDFAHIVAEPSFMIRPSTGGEMDWQSGASTGPFILKEFEPGVRAFFVKNPNYFKEGLPYFDELELLTIADQSARTNALITGSVDVIDRVELKTAHLLGRNPGVKIEETTGMLHYTLPMHSDQAPFDNNDVRLALKYAVDRDDMVDKILYGHGSVGNDHPISMNNPFFDTNLEQRTYDPDKAKFHLKRAGLDKLSVSIHLADAAFAGAVDAGILYREHAAVADIDLDVVREPNDGYWSNVWMKKPFVASYWLGRTSAAATLQLGYAASADYNEGFFQHERFNQLLDTVTSELDENLQREMYSEMQRILRDEGGSVIPMFGNYVFAMSDKVAHGDMSGVADLDGQKFVERWWFS